MTKRARYDGPYEEIAVFSEDIYAPPIDVVKRGGLLSTDVPARIRDELLARPDWTEVKDPGEAQRKAAAEREAEEG